MANRSSPVHPGTIVRRTVLAAAALLSSACGSSSPTTAPSVTTPAATVTAVSVTVDGEAVLTGVVDRSQLTAVAAMSDGTTLDVTKTAKWQSSDLSVAAVADSSGVVTTYGGGTATVTATYQSAAGSFDLTVTPTTRTVRGVLTAQDGRRGMFTLTVAGDLAPVGHPTTAQVSGVLEFPNEPADLPVTGFYDQVAGSLNVSTISSGSIVFWLTGAVTNHSLAGTFTGPDGVAGAFSATTP